MSSSSARDEMESARVEVMDCEKEIQTIKEVLRRAGNPEEEEAPNMMKISALKVIGLPETAKPSFKIQVSSPIEELFLSKLYDPLDTNAEGSFAKVMDVDTSCATLSVVACDNNIHLGSSEHYDAAPFCTFDAQNPSRKTTQIDIAIVADETTKNNDENKTSVGSSTTPTSAVTEVVEPAKEEVTETSEPAKEEVTETTEPAKEEVTETAEPAKEEVTETAEPAKEEVTETVGPAKEEVTETAGPAKEEVTETAEPTAKEELTETAELTNDEATETAEPTKEELTETAEPTSKEESTEDKASKEDSAEDVSLTQEDSAKAELPPQGEENDTHEDTEEDNTGLTRSPSVTSATSLVVGIIGKENGDVVTTTAEVSTDGDKEEAVAISNETTDTAENMDVSVDKNKEDSIVTLETKEEASAAANDNVPATAEVESAAVSPDSLENMVEKESEKAEEVRADSSASTAMSAAPSDDTSSTTTGVIVPVCVVTFRIEFTPSKKEEKEALYELLNKASQRKTVAVDKLRKSASALSRSTTRQTPAGETPSSGNPPTKSAVKSGFLNRKAAPKKKEPNSLMKLYNRTIGPDSMFRKVFPIAKNYCLFFGAVALFHFKGHELALPAPV